MNENKILDSINILLTSTKPGFSNVNDFTEWIYSNRKYFGISHVITYWLLRQGNIEQEFCYFGGGMEYITIGLDLSGMLNQKEVINTNQEKYNIFRGTDFWSGSHIISFPIDGIENNLYSLSGIVVFISKDNNIDINANQISILNVLLKNVRPSDLNHHSVLDCCNNLKQGVSISHEIDQRNPEDIQLYKVIIDSIDRLVEDKTIKGSGLKHYSQWEILNTISDPIMLSKIFSHNPMSNEAHSITHVSIDSSTLHYLVPILDTFDKSKSYSGGWSIIPLSIAKQSFIDSSYFEKLGLNDRNGTVLTFIKREKNTIGCLLGHISCYYIQDLPYTIFTSPLVVSTISTQIYNTIINVGTYLNIKLLYSFAIGFDEDSNDRMTFFKKISNLLADWNGADECLIYQIDSYGHFQNMLNFENEKEEFELVNGLSLPSRLANDVKFTEFLNDISFKQGSCNLTECCNLYYNNDNYGIKSAMVLSSSLNSQIVNNIIILINKKPRRQIEGTFFNDAFSFYYSLQTCLCGIFLYHYNLLLQSLDTKNYLLKKFRHELPSCTDAIKSSILLLKQSSDENRNLSQKNLMNILNMMELNNSRIALLANFFSTVDFNDSKFAENRKNTSFNVFMNSYIDSFRTEGLYRGVDVYFKCVNNNGTQVKDIEYNVSNYFLLSVVNVIINAIRYAAPGTCVNVVASPDKIEVTDIGIPIKDGEKDKIFEEGFRGENARKINEKGMGYGLYLTKRIIESHNGIIYVASEFELAENLYLEYAVYKYYLSLPIGERDKFIYEMADEIEFRRIQSELNRIKKVSTHHIDLSFLNAKEDVIQKWIKYQADYMTSFIDYPDLFFDNEIYRVTFTMQL